MPDAIYTNTAETGLSDGTVVTTGNSDDGAAGDAFANVQGTWVYETDAAKSGALGYRLTVDATSRYLRGDDPSPSGRGGMGGWFYYPGGVPSASFAVAVVRTAADAVVASLNIFTDGKLYAYTRTGTRITTGGSGTSSALSAGWYRFQLMYTPGGSTTTATLEGRVWDAAGTSLMTYLNTAGYDAGVTDPGGRYRFGNITNTSGFTTWDMDNLRWGHVASGDIGDVANASPTGSITANQNVAASAAVTATVSASDSDGTIASYAWTYVSASSTGSPTLSGSSTATVGFTAGAVGNLYTLQCIVTDNGGATATFTTEVRVPTTSTTPVPLAINATEVGTWTITGGSSTDGAALADASDSTYLESPTATGVEATSRTRLQPMTVRSALTITERLALDTAGSVTVQVRLFEGSTERQEWTVVPTTSIADYACAVTTPGAITDWGNLWVERSIVSV
jgi:hypothetical protein